MATSSRQPARAGRTPVIRLERSGVLYDLDMSIRRKETRLVLRCTDDGEIFAAISAVPCREEDTACAWLPRGTTHPARRPGTPS